MLQIVSEWGEARGDAAFAIKKYNIMFVKVIF